MSNAKTSNCDDDETGKKFLSSISTPGQDSTAIVQTLPPPPQFHFFSINNRVPRLCQANGPVSVPDGYTLVGVFGKISTDGSSPTNDDVYKNSAGSDTVCAGGFWNLDKKLPAAAIPLPVPNGQLNNNLLTVVTVAKNSPFGTPTIVGSNQVSFIGVAGTCSATPVLKQESAEMSTLPIEGIDFLNPVDCDNGWLLYRFNQGFHSTFPPNVPARGPVLMANGVELQASVLAIAVQNVLWRHSQDFDDPDLGPISIGGVSRRPLGDIVTPTDEDKDAFYFGAAAPKNAIAIWQDPFPSRDRFVHVLASQSRRHPDFVHLVPTESIRIQFNYDLRENVQSGQFDLWVKVIDKGISS